MVTFIRVTQTEDIVKSFLISDVIVLYVPNGVPMLQLWFLKLDPY